MDCEVHVTKCLKEKVEEATNLLNTCKTKLNIESGKIKLQKNIESEIRFLNRLLANPHLIKDEHLRSSNISHHSAIVNCALSQYGCEAVLQKYHILQKNGSDKRIVVDIVANNGGSLIKVIARNPQALLQSSLGEGEFGRRTQIEQLEDMLECAVQNPHLYQPAIVKAYFSPGTIIPPPLKLLIEEMGVEVIEGADDSDMTQSNKLASIPQEVLLNLDVSCMLAYVSNLSNGHYKFKFADKCLTEQAIVEAKNPIKPELDKLFQGNTLMCTQSALQSFLTIVDTVGGVQEKERASQLISRLKVVPDQVSDQAEALEISASVKVRSKIIFGTGDRYKAITVTSNASFIRSAKAQGIKFVAYIHASRALTERKESEACHMNHL